jgi:hypothetical protein
MGSGGVLRMRPHVAAPLVKTLGALALFALALPQGARADTPAPLPYIAREFKRLPRASQVAAVKAVQDFLRKWEGVLAETYEVETASGWSLFEEAWAAGERCLYGGWTSSLGASGKCSSPERGNPLYDDLFKKAGCGEGGFLCSPALFGAKTCLPRSQRRGKTDAETRSLIASTYQNCRRKFSGSAEDVVKHIESDPAALKIFQETIRSIEETCDNSEHPQKKWGMCRNIKRDFDRIFQLFAKKYPDVHFSHGCYEALNLIKGCASSGERDRQKCGYPKFLRAFRVPGSTSEVVVTAPEKAEFGGTNDDPFDLNFFRLKDVRLAANKDVEQLAGKSVEQVKALGFWESSDSWASYYAAINNEITLQLSERVAEYEASAKPNEPLLLKLRAVVLACKDVKHAAFRAERLKACRISSADPARCEGGTQATERPEGSGARPGR